ncbi:MULTISPECIES: head-tail connector protein [Bacillus amyloliquefaciens group]|uniref:head-tail connector protein n=1 Tax=Bacillus amyloliquefaciens group TaxID=1938374 RepID=UPI0013F596CB|nr:head-tail connector protein [Bacillus velezensis]MEC2287287.1 head-tail connector protein [Bacillus velezensis]MEC2422438.1 head-tail connector protein [Bacillus velezensis]WFF76303.1 head-tail connector protein [Bacillus velezensis]WFF76378.1 head-tail connector protein [Bacillus velezensis]
MMFESVKRSLRITHNFLDDEILELVAAARQDLVQSGVSASKAESEEDPLIKRAIITYCKANFGLSNVDSEKYQRSYDMLKNHLALASDYNV